jgi:hypothetical protein
MIATCVRVVAVILAEGYAAKGGGLWPGLTEMALNKGVFADLSKQRTYRRRIANRGLEPAG